MQRMFMLLCVQLLLLSRSYAQCGTCAELITVRNSDFSGFNPPLSGNYYLCPGPYIVPGGTGGMVNRYFSNSNLPYWYRDAGAPVAGSGFIGLATINKIGAGGGAWCSVTGRQSAFTYYPFVKDGKYEVTLDMDWHNYCLAPSNVEFVVRATTGLSEPAIPSFPVGTPFSGVSSVMGAWYPSPNSGGAETRVFCSDPMPNDFDQFYMGAFQFSAEYFGSTDPYSGEVRGFSVGIKSVKIRLCNECPTDIFFVNSSASPEPVTGKIFSDGGLFIDALIKIDGTVPLNNTPAVNTLLTARCITANYPVSMGHSFTARADMGKYFEMIPSSACGVVCNVEDIVGPQRICVAGDVIFTDATAGGVWMSSDPGVLTIDGTTASVHGIHPGTATITYTVGGCSVSKVITVTPPGECGQLRGLATTAQDSISNLVNIYPNPALDKVSVSFPYAAAGQLNLVLKDLNGKVYYNKDTNYTGRGTATESIDLSKITPGIYVLEFTYNDQHVIKKIVKL